MFSDQKKITHTHFVSTSLRGCRVLMIFILSLFVFTSCKKKLPPDAPFINPTAPTSLTVTKAGADSAALSWTAPAHDYENAVVGYHIYMSTTSGSGYTKVEAAQLDGLSTAVVPGTTCTVTNLTDGTTYYFIVRASDKNGQEFAASSETAYIMDNTQPSVQITYSPPSGMVSPGHQINIIAVFSEPIMETPAVKFSLSGGNTLAATDMNRMSATVYQYLYTATAGTGTVSLTLSGGRDATGNDIKSVPDSGATFTVNSIPVADNVTAGPQFLIGTTLNGNFSFSDTDGDSAGTSTYKWYSYDDNACLTGETVIGTNQNHTLTTNEKAKYILFEATPVAATGNTVGQPKVSICYGPVAPWIMIDGNGINGINKDPGQSVWYPKIIVFNGKLYATWHESNGTKNQIRVAVYNGNDSAPVWSFVDGNGANGINKNTGRDASSSELTAFNGKLYATWHESNGTKNQIRVAVYNGNDSAPAWSFVDGNGANGINKNTSNSAEIPQLTVFGSKLYAIWDESNGTIDQIRVVVYNGNDSAPVWNFVDGNGTNGINKNTGQHAYKSQLTEFNSKLYATWNESNGTKIQIRVSVYNGNDSAPAWNFVDGNGANGINKDTGKDARNPQLTVFGGNLYTIWQEENGSKYHIRVAVYNGNDSAPAWSFVDGNDTAGLSKISGQDVEFPQLTVFNSKLYATWQEFNGTAYQIRVAEYNGNDSAPVWSFADGNGTNGINKNPGQKANHSQLTVFGSKLYAIWIESNGTKDQARVRVMQ